MAFLQHNRELTIEMFNDETMVTFEDVLYPLVRDSINLCVRCPSLEIWPSTLKKILLLREIKSYMDPEMQYWILLNSIGGS